MRRQHTNEWLLPEASMSSITISLSDERLRQIQELARRVNVTPEELVRAGVEDWLRQPRDDFERAAALVLEKNAELYRRLDEQEHLIFPQRKEVRHVSIAHRCPEGTT